MNRSLRRAALATAAAFTAGVIALAVPAVSAANTDAKAVTLTLLHNNDGESSLDTSTLRSGTVTYRYGGIAAFKAVFDREKADARKAGNAVFGVYAGDSFLASKTLICSQPADTTSKVKPYDALALRQVGYDALVLGNHEFDYAPCFLSRYLRTFAKNGKPTIPVLSGNMDFKDEPDLSDLIGPTGQTSNKAAPGKNISQWMIYTDEVTGAKFGIVTAVTPLLATISSPGKSKLLTGNIDAVAARLQRQINAMQKMGVNKIILVSHLQDLNNDKALVAKLRGVDVAVGGGGDELLQSDYVSNTVELLPGESAPVGTYPTNVTDAAGKVVPIVTTSGNYKYVGRVDVRFDKKGNVAEVVQATSYPRRVIPTSGESVGLGITDAVSPDFFLQTKVIGALNGCLSSFNVPFAKSDVLFNTARGSATAPGVRTVETNGGNLVADSFVYLYDQVATREGFPARSATNPVVAVQNGGGIRQNAGDLLPVSGAAPGTINRGNTFDLLPFDNRFSVFSNMTAAQLKEVFERSCAIGTSGGGQFLQISGLKVTCKRSGTAQVVGTPPAGLQYGAVTTAGSRVTSLSLSDGTKLVDNGTVVAGAPAVDVITNSFTAVGGDNFPTFGAAASKVLGYSYEEALYRYLLSFPKGADGLPTVPASDARYKSGGEGRITWVP
ncbi:MAG: bifunctional metallophosphatase/5'-nucleotidase [Ilumatobacteraceae bacterium]